MDNTDLSCGPQGALPLHNYVWLAAHKLVFEPSALVLIALIDIQMQQIGQLALMVAERKQILL